MSQSNVFSQVQQFGAGWIKLWADSATKLAELAQVDKFEKQGVATAHSAVDEAGRLAKEVIASAESLSAQWRKTVTSYAERTLDLVGSKD